MTTGRSRGFTALADATRLAVLERLAEGPSSATALCSGLGVTRQAVDKHLAVLAAAGMVVSRRAGREVRHRLDPRGFDQVASELGRLRGIVGHGPAGDEGRTGDGAGSGSAGRRRPGPSLQPVSDLDAGVADWRALGFDVLWRPDGATAVLGRAGRAGVMCVDHAMERALGPGPVMLVDSLDRDRPTGVAWRIAPCRVAAGRYAAVTTASGQVVRFLEVSPDAPDVFGTRPEAAGSGTASSRRTTARTGSVAGTESERAGASDGGPAEEERRIR